MVCQLVFINVFYLEREGFSGMARWMQKQSAEETGHAYAGYMISVRRHRK